MEKLTKEVLAELNNAYLTKYITQEPAYNPLDILRTEDNTEFEKITLAYDTFNPDESLTTQLIITTPIIANGWEVRYKNEIETTFNENVTTTGEFTEISI